MLGLLTDNEISVQTHSSLTYPKALNSLYKPLCARRLVDTLLSLLLFFLLDCPTGLVVTCQVDSRATINVWQY